MGLQHEELQMREKEEINEMNFVRLELGERYPVWKTSMLFLGI